MSNEIKTKFTKSAEYLPYRNNARSNQRDTDKNEVMCLIFREKKKFLHSNKVHEAGDLRNMNLKKLGRITEHSRKVFAKTYMLEENISTDESLLL